MQNPGKFELKGIELDDARLELLTVLSKVLKKFLGDKEFNEPLHAARGLVKIVFSLPNWVKKTRNVSYATMRFKNSILRASDPYKVLFHDLPSVFKTDDPNEIASQTLISIDELVSLHSKLINDLSTLLLLKLGGSESDISGLRARAKNIQGTGRELTNAFISQIANLQLSENSILEVFGLLAEKSFQHWGDVDIKLAKSKLILFAQEFRELEIAAEVNQREPNRQAIGLVFGGEPGKEFVKQFDTFKEQQQELKSLSEKLLTSLLELPHETKFAVLAQTFETLYNEKENSSNV